VYHGVKGQHCPLVLTSQFARAVGRLQILHADLNRYLESHPLSTINRQHVVVAMFGLVGWVGKAYPHRFPSVPKYHGMAARRIPQ
jgi:hypothetical protein